MGIQRSASKARKRTILLRIYGAVCFWCGKTLPPRDHHPDKSPIGITIDELRPRSRGGFCVLENQVLAHKVCNARRGNMIAPQEAFDRHHEVLRKHGLMAARN